MNAFDYVLSYITSDGPVSLDDIARYLEEQLPGVESGESFWIAKQSVSNLIRDGRAQRYDDGRPETFVIKK